MHICLLTPSYPPQVDGGVAIATGRLTDQLLALGHRVTVITSKPPQTIDTTGSYVRPASRLLTVHEGMIDDPLQAPAALKDLCTWAEKHHRQQPFDVLLAYFVYPGGYLATTLGTRLALPVVCSCRGNDISKDLFINPQIVAHVLTRSTRLIFVCASLLHMADTLVPCQAKSTVIPNAVDAQQFVPATKAVQAEPREITLGTSGLLRWKKGIDLFLPLIARLCATQPLKVLIAGYPLDSAVEQHMAAFLRTHDLQRRVELTGPIPHRHMVHAIQRMDLYVNTSYQEGMPNGILEAMACALPVVATDADGTPELVEDGQTGYLCRMGDLDKLIDRCQRLIAQPHLRQRMGHAGRQRVLRHFSLQREVQAIMAVLQEACRARA